VIDPLIAHYQAEALKEGSVVSSARGVALEDDE